jgi:hypothetical protein
MKVQLWLLLLAWGIEVTHESLLKTFFSSAKQTATRLFRDTAARDAIQAPTVSSEDIKDLLQSNMVLRDQVKKWKNAFENEKVTCGNLRKLAVSIKRQYAKELNNAQSESSSRVFQIREALRSEFEDKILHLAAVHKQELTDVTTQHHQEVSLLKDKLTVQGSNAQTNTTMASVKNSDFEGPLEFGCSSAHIPSLSAPAARHSGQQKPVKRVRKTSAIGRKLNRKNTEGIPFSQLNKHRGIQNEVLKRKFKTKKSSR